jgi:hypothetical protein
MSKCSIDGGRIMTNLDCTVYGCVYNSDNSCNRGNIHVGGKEAMKPSETLCRSFEQKGSSNTKNSVKSSAGNSTAEKAARATDISCDAVKCRYNQDMKCHAQHIRIAGVHAVASCETECGSYEAK